MLTTMNYKKGRHIQKRINAIVPGGCHTYAKGDDQYPEFMPAYITRGKGCHIWDIDENEYIEYGMGLRSVILGHAFEPIIKAAYSQMLKGSNYVRPATIELECAEEFLSVIENADMVKFCKNGSDATNGAVKLARAYTARDKIAVCEDHPFFSVNDWFIATTPMDAGIPKVVKEMTVKFSYNNIESVERMFSDNPDQISCVILEAEKNDPPKNNFLHKLKDLCHKNGALFILDEIMTGFRWHLGGAQKKYNIVPDLSTFGKALGNGFSIAALAGKREYMETGGIHHNKERVFLLSYTNGAENHALAATIATIKFFKENNVIDKLDEQGRKLKDGINRASNDLKLENYVSVIGPNCCSVYATRNQDEKPSQSFRTLFIQETMKRGLLMPSTVVSYSHSDKDISETIEKIHDALVIYKKALNEGVEKYLEGRPSKVVFRKYS